MHSSWKIGAALLTVSVAVVGVVRFRDLFLPDSRSAYEKLLATHAFNPGLQPPEADGSEPEQDRPDLAMQQNFLMTMDPALLRPTPERLYDWNAQTAAYRDYPGDESEGTLSTSIATATAWTERGPREVGGRTRALLFDPADAAGKKVWAGGVSGGLWVNNDITSATSAWQKVNDFWDNLAVSCIAADPNNNQVMYVGTGEFEWTVRGGGIWKTSNGGLNWSRLGSSAGFFEIRDLVVRNEAGISVVYAAVQPGFGGDNPAYSAGLFRSADGGTNWAQVLPFAQGSATYTNLPSDLEIGKDNSLWVGTRKHYWVAEATSTIYRSTTGVAGSWTAFSTFPGSTGFNGQVELALSPSDENVAYAVMEQSGKIGELFRTGNKGGTWNALAKPIAADLGIPASDFSRGQAWWDLIIAVNPTNANEVYVAAIDWFRSTDGGSAWTQISKWSNNANMNTLTCPLVHADQHELLFRPGSAAEVIISNDGGVYYSPNISAAVSALVIQPRNLNFNVTQFYSGAAHPVQVNYFLGGTQDNGTQRFSLAGFGPTTTAFGGDGAACFIDQLDPSFQIVSYVYNRYYLSKDGGVTFPFTLLLDDNTGLFINVAEYDSYQKVLFSSRDNASIYRVRNVTTTRSVDNIPIAGLGAKASALRVSPYATAQTNLYVGTQSGRLFKVIGAQATPMITEITNTAFPTANISSIDFGADENQILVTFSNYGIVHVWETRNGGNTWINREGNLPNMPVRWAEYHPINFNQVYLATELGVWSTDNINVSNPVWNSTNGGLANVRVDMLRFRESDKVLMAATHGRGVFTALVPLELEQIISFPELPTKTFGDAPYELSATATSGLAVSFTSSNPAVATIANSTVTIVGAGSTTITATQTGNVQYKAAPPVTQTLTVDKASQTIIFGALPTKAVNEPPFTLIASTTSNLPVSFVSSNSGVATVLGNTLTIAGPGTTTITASQPGNANYAAATAVPRSLIIITRIIQMPASISMGEVFLGEKKSQVALIESIGTAPLTVGTITYPPGFTGTSKVVGGNTELTVTFTPTDVITYTGDIIVSSDATSGGNKISITGKGIKITEVNADSPESATLFPNPVQAFLTVRVPGVSDLKWLRVTDAAGREHLLESSPAGPDEVRVFVGDLAPGAYLISIPATAGTTMLRFQKISN